MNGDEARNGLNPDVRGSAKGAGDPEGGAPLHTTKILQGFLITSALVEP